MCMAPTALKSTPKPAAAPLTHFHAQAAQAADQHIGGGHAPHGLLAVHRQLRDRARVQATEAMLACWGRRADATCTIKQTSA